MEAQALTLANQEKKESAENHQGKETYVYRNIAFRRIAMGRWTQKSLRSLLAVTLLSGILSVVMIRAVSAFF